MVDTRSFLEDHFGSAAGLTAFLRHYCRNAAPNEEAVMKWFSRRAVPGSWWPVMLHCLARDRGRPVDLAAYVAKEIVR